jgi:hypothetical protein
MIGQQSNIPFQGNTTPSEDAPSSFRIFRGLYVRVHDRSLARATPPKPHHHREEPYHRHPVHRALLGLVSAKTVYLGSLTYYMTVGPYFDDKSFIKWPKQPRFTPRFLTILSFCRWSAENVE